MGISNTEMQIIPSETEAYLAKLPQKDQINLRRISENFRKIMEEEGRKGALVVVGGTIDKPMPRKDIDILLILQENPTDAKKGTSTELDFAVRDFETFKHLTEKIAQESNLKIKEIIDPCMDEEFNSPSILKTDGSIVVEGKEEVLTPIEFIRIRERGRYEEILGKSTRPVIILEAA